MKKIFFIIYCVPGVASTQHTDILTYHQPTLSTELGIGTTPLTGGSNNWAEAFILSNCKLQRRNYLNLNHNLSIYGIAVEPYLSNRYLETIVGRIPFDPLLSDSGNEPANKVNTK